MHVFISAFLIFFILLPSVASASDDIVEKVTVSIICSQTPPARIAKRMATSVGTVGEQMIVGRNVSEVAANKASYEKLIKEIFDRVLVGYSVQSVNLVPGSSAMIEVEIAPWGDVVREVDLEVDLANLSPEIKNLVQKDMGNIEEKVSNVLVGLPIDAVDWAGGISKIVIREILSEQLPEFRANFDIIPGARSVVKISLSPIGSTVQDVHVSLRSHTIPNLLLVALRPAVDQIGKNLVGLPVAFIERHRDYFTEKLKANTVEHPVAKRYGLSLTPLINPGTDTEIVLGAETDKYNVSLESNLDMGRSKDNTSFKLHVGSFIGKNDEAFMEVHFIPSTVSWDFVPGWGHTLNKGTTAGIKYDISDQHNIIWLQQEINRNVMVRLERTPMIGKNEFGVRYKLHDFLSAEYIFTKQEKWLRLIGNL